MAKRKVITIVVTVQNPETEDFRVVRIITVGSRLKLFENVKKYPHGLTAREMVGMLKNIQAGKYSTLDVGDGKKLTIKQDWL